MSSVPGEGNPAQEPPPQEQLEQLAQQQLQQEQQEQQQQQQQQQQQPQHVEAAIADPNNGSNLNISSTATDYSSSSQPFTAASTTSTPPQWNGDGVGVGGSYGGVDHNQASLGQQQQQPVYQQEQQVQQQQQHLPPQKQEAQDLQQTVPVLQGRQLVDPPPAVHGPFSFTPENLMNLIDPKSPEKLEACGGVEGILAGLHADPVRGLSTPGNTHLDRVVADGAEKVAAPSYRCPADASAVSLQDREQFFGRNVLPKRKPKSIFQLMWIALQEKILVRIMEWTLPPMTE